MGSLVSKERRAKVEGDTILSLKVLFSSVFSSQDLVP